MLRIILSSICGISAAVGWAQTQIDPGVTPAAWSPYLAGGMIGVLVWLTLGVSGQRVGASGAYAKVAGVAGRMVAPRHTGSLKYYNDNPPGIDWEVLFVTGIVLGSFLAAWSGGELTGRWLAPMWVERFGDSVWLRMVVAFSGGAIMSFGARLAGGCTSGHGISGAMHLSVGSWIALVCFFVGGVIVANLMFRI